MIFNPWKFIRQQPQYKSAVNKLKANLKTYIQNNPNDVFGWLKAIVPNNAGIDQVASAAGLIQPSKDPYQQVKDQIQKNLELNLRQLQLQREQAQSQAEQSIKERHIQGLKTIGANQAWMSATGLVSSGSSGRLVNALKADEAKDVSIINTNLENYLQQALVQEQQLKLSAESDINNIDLEKQTFKDQQNSQNLQQLGSLLLTLTPYILKGIGGGQ